MVTSIIPIIRIPKENIKIPHSSYNPNTFLLHTVTVWPVTPSIMCASAGVYISAMDFLGICSISGRQKAHIQILESLSNNWHPLFIK